jgi:hypothetical protein
VFRAPPRPLLPTQPKSLGSALLPAVLLLSLAAGCARPYKGPKTLAAVSLGLLASGATLWALGDRGNHDAITKVGVATTASGAVAAFAAGGWLVVRIGCRVDPDCPEGEVCKEVPAAAGREPYYQCVPR